MGCGSAFFARPVASIHCRISVIIGLSARPPLICPVVCLKSPPISVLAITGSICL